jgi:hypothetical protein
MAQRGKPTLESVLAASGPALLEVAVERGLEGDSASLKLALERLLPRERVIQLDLSQIENVDDLLKSIGVVILDVSKGRLSPSEGSTLVQMLSAMRAAFETCEMESRLRAIELALPGPQAGSGTASSNGGKW